MEVAHPHSGRLGSLVDIAVECQRDPERHIAYVGGDVDALTAEISEVEDWPSFTTIAEEGERVLGWLLAEADRDMGRVWWWGPFVVDDTSWGDVAHALYEAARAGLEGIGEEEMVADARSGAIPRFARLHGFQVEEGSALLVRRPSAPLTVHPAVVAMTDVHVDGVVAIHDRLFPGTHTTGSSLVSLGTDRRDVLVVVVENDVVGYVATELQHDGSLYVDYLGVDSDHARRGYGRMLVSTACALGFEHGATRAHLSVRESNRPARALYRSLGFVEERVIHPYRKGFTLG